MRKDALWFGLPALVVTVAAWLAIPGRSGAG
jgi:hypothetical protein